MRMGSTRAPSILVAALIAGLGCAGCAQSSSAVAVVEESRLPGRGLFSPWWLTVVVKPSTGDVTVPGDVLFLLDSAKVEEAGAARLRELAPRLGNGTSLITVAGATDGATGTPEYNIALSRRRAEAVVDVLVSAGVDRARLVVQAWGSRCPIADEAGPDPAEARARNRRVVIVTRADIVGRSGETCGG